MYSRDVGSESGALFNMLGQVRVIELQMKDDMSRAEELSTKFRTLSYDHDRLVTMHRTATEKAANAERETHLHKSRLAYVQLYLPPLPT